MAADFPETDRTKLRRMPKRGHFDRDTVYGILDEGLVCHVGMTMPGGPAGDTPVVIPTAYGRMGDSLILHGKTSSGLSTRMASGAQMCITVTLLDGLVLARSTMHSSMNFRSVVIYGRGYLIEDEAAKAEALASFVEHVCPGRGTGSRPANPAELTATAVIRVPLEEASAKVRVGNPGDDAADIESPDRHWSGVIPLVLASRDPIPDPTLKPGIRAPDHITKFERQPPMVPVASAAGKSVITPTLLLAVTLAHLFSGGVMLAMWMSQS